MYIAKAMGLDNIPVKFVNSSNEAINKFLIENDLSDLYNYGRGESGVNIGESGYIVGQEQSNQRLQNESSKKFGNKKGASSNAQLVEAQLPMGNRPYGDSTTIGSERLYKTNDNETTTRNNEQNNEQGAIMLLLIMFFFYILWYHITDLRWNYG